jgi:hypothetical protein
MAGEDALQIRITADFREVESAFLNLGKISKSFEGDIKRVAGNVSKEFNKIEGTAKLFGDASNVVKDKMDVLRSSMERLMSMGFQPANKYVQELKTKYDSLASSLVVVDTESKKVKNTLDTTANTVKKSNQQWTNWALVLQDLPYGFRGIQNNLPALMGGIAGLAGPMYLVGSAIIALFTAWDQGSFKALTATDKLAEAHKKNAEVLKKGAEEEARAIIEMQKLRDIFAAVKANSMTAKEGLLEYNKAVGDTWGNAKSLNEAETEFIKKSEAYVKSVALRAMADEKYAQASEAFKKGRLAEGSEQVGFFKKLKIADAATAAGAGASLGFMGFDAASIATSINYFFKNVAYAQRDGVNEVIKQSKKDFKLLTAEGAALSAEASKTLKDAGIKGKGGKTPKKVKQPKEKKEKQDTFDLLKTTKEYYAAKLNFAEGDEIAQKEILLREKQTFDELILSNQISWSDYYNNISQIYKKLIDFQIKEDKRLYDAQVTLANNNIDNVKSKLGVELKLNKKNTVLQQDAIKKAMATLTVLAATSFNPEAIIAYQNAFANLQSQLEGFGGTGQKIADILNNTIANGVSAMAKSIGNAISTGTLDFTALGEVLATGLIQIGEALIAFALLENTAIQSLKDPALWPVALAAGIAAVVAGSLLSSSLSKDKTKKFANGGIISGPTMGLMGEYPGAQNNPEVVAPLDKLKEMIGGNGGGGGQFVLRGQDLLLSVNRAQKSSYLKGQNINLV